MYKIVKVIKLFKKLPQRILEDFFMIIIIYYNNNNNYNNNNFLFIFIIIIIIIIFNNFFHKKYFHFFHVPECSMFWVLSTGVNKTWNMEHSGTF